MAGAVARLLLTEAWSGYETSIVSRSQLHHVIHCGSICSLSTYVNEIGRFENNRVFAYGFEEEANVSEGQLSRR